MFHRVLPTVLLLSLFLFAGLYGQPQSLNCEVRQDRYIRIGTLYMNIDTRKKMREGVEEALRDISLKDGREVCLVDLSYTKVHEGLQNLRSAVENEEVDIIIGPTESDLFVQALEDRDAFEAHQIPIISPLITADIEVRDTNWFFRTNVGVNRRAQAIFDYLRKYWIRSTAVLYDDTEFGRRAQEAFKAEVLREFNSTGLYLAESFKSPPDIRPHLGEILKRRPEAVGIFGEREDIRLILTDLDSMDESGTSYRPVLFTVLDARQIKDATDEMLFVSVTQPEMNSEALAPDGYDDVKALAYDTMYFVLKVIDQLQAPSVFSSRKKYRGEFRNQFAAIVNGGSDGSGPKTNMQFSEYVNTTTPKVYQFSKQSVGLAGLHNDVSAVSKLGFKIGLIKRRFGVFPMIFNLLVIVAVVFTTSMWDLIRWYEGKARKLLRYRRTYYLLALQFVASLALYLYLAETGKIQYNSFVMTVVIAMAPSSLFRAKLLETPAGKTLGLAKLYDQLLVKLNEGLMVKKYEDMEERINIIAQYNSEVGMRTELKAIFGNARTPEQRARHFRELDAQLKNAETSFERRKVYARNLLKRLDWDGLRARRLIPPDMDENGDVTGPLKLIRASVQHCLLLEGGAQKVETLMNNLLPHYSQEVQAFYKRKVDEVETPRDKLYSKIRFLVLEFNYSEQKLKQEGLLPTNGKRSVTVVEEKKTPDPDAGQPGLKGKR